MEYRWYKLYASSDAEGLYLVKDELPIESYLYERQLREWLQTTGSVIEQWPALRVFNGFANRKHLSLDFAMAGFAFRTAMSRRAMERMREKLGSYVEWLPLQVQDGREFFLPHPLVVVDALDKERSAITYVTDYPMEPEYVTSVHGEWMYDDEKLEGVPMFRTPETLFREVYVSAEFAEFIEESELSGVCFSPVQLSSER